MGALPKARFLLFLAQKAQTFWTPKIDPKVGPLEPPPPHPVGWVVPTPLPPPGHDGCLMPWWLSKSFLTPHLQTPRAQSGLLEWPKEDYRYGGFSQENACQDQTPKNDNLSFFRHLVIKKMQRKPIRGGGGDSGPKSVRECAFFLYKLSFFSFSPEERVLSETSSLLPTDVGCQKNAGESSPSLIVSPALNSPGRFLPEHRVSRPQPGPSHPRQPFGSSWQPIPLRRTPRANGGLPDAASLAFWRS